MKLIKWICFGLVLLLLPVMQQGCSSGEQRSSGSEDELRGTISISGAFALYPLTVRWAEEFRREHPRVRIDISAGGAGKGMADVLSGMVDLAMFSREITQAELDRGAWLVAVSKDAVVATVNSNNPFADQLKRHGITRETFMDIYLSQRIKKWNQIPELSGPDHPINVYTRSDACGAAEVWGEYLGKNQESLRGIGVFGDPGIADAVKNDRFGMGYNNVIYAYDINTRKKFDGIEIIPLDINNNGIIDEDESFYGTLDELCEAIAAYRYPSPPARDLYLVSRGKPTNRVVIAFLEWVLENGQQFVGEAGYVNLSDEKISKELERLQ